MKIAIELVFFQDLANLQRLIPTINEFVNKIIAIDGRHTTFNKYNDLSNDGSREYLKSFDKIILIDMPDYEVNKRIKAKQICKKLDIYDLIILDSDEYVIGNWNDFESNYRKTLELDNTCINLYKLKLQRLDNPEAFTNNPILFHNPHEFTYYQNKHNIPIKISEQNKYDIFAPKSFDNTVEGIKIMHDHKLRSKERQYIRNDNLTWQFINKT